MSLQKFKSKRSQSILMFQVKPMSVKDYEFAVELANTMDWNMATEDFQFMASLEPEGCFIAFEGTQPVGIATCINYGRVGWFGNLIVKEQYRKKCVGSLLVNHSTKYLQSKGVQTIGLYAYPNLVGFYSNLGFQPDEEFSVLHSQKLPSISAARTLPSVSKEQLAAIEKFDSECFGGERKKLLESIIPVEGNLSYYVPDGDGVVGYVAATVYTRMAWVGPLICRQSNFEDAASLVKAVLADLAGKNVYAVAPKNARLRNLFLKLGFKEDFSVLRMFFGEAVAKNCIYLAESLERG
jgi:GNAT superfamily N-acetyltransferase